MKKLLLFLALVIASLGANGQIIIVNGCNGSGDNINGPYYLTGTDGNGRNIYQANYYHSLCAYTSSCRPQVISYGPHNDETGWHIRTGPYQVLAYSNEPGTEDPPVTGWLQQAYSYTCTAMTISYPETVESKNCTDCNWSDPNTWVTGTVPTPNDHVVINGQVILDIDASTLNLDILTGKSLEDINNKSVTVKGKYNNLGFLKAHRLTLQSYTIPQTVDGTKLSIREFRVDNLGEVTLTGNLEVLKQPTSNTSNVQLIGGSSIFLADFDLICHGIEIGSLTNNRSRVITNGTGALKFKVPAGSVNKEFIIGRTGYDDTNFRSNIYALTVMGSGVNSESNQPVTISVNLSEFSPTHQLPENSNVIPMVWNITSDHTSLENPFTLIFGWNANDIPPGFNMNNMYIKRWNGNNWENKAGPRTTGYYNNIGYRADTDNDVTEFSTWAIFDSETVLPVILKTFEVNPENRTALLTWATTAESNSSHFDIEHSTDAGAWMKAGRVNAKGESNDLRRYSFSHHPAKDGQHYYRLKMTDMDGTFTYSPIRSVRFGSAAGEEMYIYPNPSSDRLYLKDSISEISSLSVISQSGQKMISDIPYSEKGISLEALPAGTYLIDIKLNDGSRISRKLLISK